MEWIKKSSIKKSLFMLNSIFLIGGLILSFFFYQFCSAIIDYNGYYAVSYITESNAQQIIKHQPYFGIWSTLQVVFPIICIVSSIIYSNIVFYNIKLKKPLETLQNSAKRIQQQDLNFSIKSYNNDELGELSRSFETMRGVLQKNTRELCRKMEERKRLNAAFAHDLRNPVTVLKGSAKMLQSNLDKGELSTEAKKDSISLMVQYTRRIEIYIEAMAKAQKLEELCCELQTVSWSEIKNEIIGSLSILGECAKKEIEFHFRGNDNEDLEIDRFIVHNTLENLVSNALRYAKSKVIVEGIYDEKKLSMTVLDDGCGFSTDILSKGPAPFFHGNENHPEDLHFGMGLYVCRLLCEKHNGSLILENSSEGAKVTAAFL